ncbi:MAG: glycosyltransferase family 4 protein [Monoglobales bacterium]
MNVLFLTMNIFTGIEMHNIYSDLMKEFIKHGHRPYIVTPRERKMGEKTELVDFDTYSLLKVQTGNTSDVSLIEKGISTVMMGTLFYNAVREKLGKLNFDLILYSTPPITLAATVSRLKKMFKCKTYLMLKDIFPQNAVDLEMFSTNSIIYKYFRRKEKQLYAVSDYIGCMSQANVDYVLKNNPEVSSDRVGICPNSIDPFDISLTGQERATMRDKYGIPQNKTVFVYGGNLGKPQGIPFLIECLRSQRDNEEVFFLIVGDGTEYSKLLNYIETEKQPNVKLISLLPKADYDKVVAACDVGMIFLDHRFTIPNFPSRLLAYMQAKLPVLAVTDPVTDIGKVICEGGFGWWCESNRVEDFCKIIRTISSEGQLGEMSVKSREYLEANYNVHSAYSEIVGVVS